MVNPRLCRGTHKSLTITGIYESPSNVNRSKFTEREAFNEKYAEFKPYEVGMQISFNMDTKISQKGFIWRASETFRRSDPRNGTQKRK
jgi:hypothetical protein